MNPWLLGNTTVRSPFRLRNGLIAVREAGLEGKIRGVQGDENLRQCLGKANVVSLGADVTASVGRKWRSAMGKLGFLYPLSDPAIGHPDFITPNGERLISSTVITGWQEAFLRSLSAYFIFNPLDEAGGKPPFSPLRHTLRIMSAVERETGDSRIRFYEVEAFVQTTSEADNLDHIVRQMLETRNLRELADNKKQFDRLVLDRIVEANGGTPKAETYGDYADTNIRYLKATGLVCATGRGIRFVDVQRPMIEKLIADRTFPMDDVDYIRTITEGAALPTDDDRTARDVLLSQIQIAKEMGAAQPSELDDLEGAADANLARHELEHLIFQTREKQFARAQAQSGREIVSYLRALLDRRRGGTDGVAIPRGEFPAYFEWAIWRAFLAMEGMLDRPWDARRFQIDQDFLPVGTAPGNGPDLIFEFDDFVLVIEVTLTSSSRQEAAEGEPVRRHVAAEAEKHVNGRKRVFGLFLALDIDTNTADTFRMGQWYLRDDTRIGLQIVPLRLADFIGILEEVIDGPAAALPHILELMRDCRMDANRDAPEWKALISKKAGEAAEVLRKAKGMEGAQSKSAS